MIEKMDKIIEGLYLGSQGSISPQELERHGITAILDVAWDTPYVKYNPNAYKYIRINLADDEENPEHMLNIATTVLALLFAADETVLVHCVSGVSRSSYIVAKFLQDLRGGTLFDNFMELQSKRKIVIWGPLYPQDITDEQKKIANKRLYENV